MQTTTQYAIRHTLHPSRDTLHSSLFTLNEIRDTLHPSRNTQYASRPPASGPRATCPERRATRYVRRSGIALIWTAIVLIVLILFAGLALDYARVYLAAHQLQNAADAAALAGARIVRIDQPLARTQAQDIGGLNYTQGDSAILELNTDNVDLNGDIIIGRYYPNIDPSKRSFVPTVPTDSEGTPRPNAVKVAAKRTESEHGPIPLIFGPIVHVNTANVSRDAIAIGEGGFGAGLLVLSEDPTLGPQYYPPLQFSGNPWVEVVDGSIQVNMPNPYLPIPASSHPTVCADEFNTVSKIDPTGGDVFCPATGLKITTDQPRIPDPYRNVPAPALNPAAQKIGTVPNGGTPVTFQPGYYPNGIDAISHGDNVTFMPGIYIIGGGINGQGGLIITGGTVCAKRVLFYIMAANEYTSGTKAGNIHVTGGTGNITITEINDVNPGLDCNNQPVIYSQVVLPYKGMSIFQSRTNYNDASVGGGNGLNIQGTLYFPKNHVKLSGGSSSLGIEVVAYTVNIDGTGPGTEHLLINYDGRNRTPAKSSYLVQ